MHPSEDHIKAIHRNAAAAEQVAEEFRRINSEQAVRTIHPYHYMVLDVVVATLSNVKGESSVKSVADAGRIVDSILALPVKQVSDGQDSKLV